MLGRLIAVPGIITFILLSFSPSVAHGFVAKLTFSFSVSRLIDGTSLRDPLSLDASSASGDILVADTGNNQIRIFNRHGVLIKSVGRLAGIRSPVGVAVGQNDDIFITEMGGSQIKRLDPTGRLLPPLPIHTSDGPPPVPGRISTADGSIYVVDRASPRVLILSEFSRGGRQIAQHASPEEPAWKVQDVVVDEDGNVYVLSSEGLAVHVFDRDGVFLRSFGVHGSKEEEFSFPTGAAIGPDGNVWIVDSFRQEIKVFDKTGQFLFSWGNTGSGDGTLFYPVDIAFSGKTLYVLEKGASRLQAFEISQP